MTRRTHPNGGFSLIEVMIIISSLAVLTLGVSSMMHNISMNASTQKFLEGTASFHEDLHTLFSDSNACTNTFAGIQLSVGAMAQPTVTGKILDASGATFKNVPSLATESYNDGAGQIASLNVVNYTDDPAPNLLNYGLATVNVGYNVWATELVHSSSTINKTIYLQVQRSSPGYKIIGCVALADMQNRFKGTDTHGFAADTSITNPDWGTPPNTPNSYLISDPTTPGAVGVGAAPTGASLEVMQTIPTGVPTPVIAWGLTDPDPFHTVSTLTGAGGGTIELGAGSGQINTYNGGGGQPYVDYHFGSAAPELYNMRIQSTGDGKLHVFYKGTGVQQDVIGFEGTNTNPYYVEVMGAPYNANYTLNVNGIINADALLVAGIQVCWSTGCSAGPSDVRLKKNIQPLSNSLEQVLKLRGVTYEWKDTHKFGPGKQIGFIAQEVEQVYPEVVNVDKTNGLKSVTYDHLIAPAIEALKSLSARSTDIKNKIDMASSESNAVTNDLDQIGARLSALEETVKKRRKGKRHVHKKPEKGGD